MKYNVILAGVGGQGVLSIANIIAQAALKEGLEIRQSEVHGMAQRGGSVLSHLRIASDTITRNNIARNTIAGDLVPKGDADLIISLEPLESLRYLSWLKHSGVLVTACEPFKNIPDYPDIEKIISSIKSLPNRLVVDAAALAKEAGLSKSVNTVMTGAASYFLPLKPQSLENTIIEIFAKKDVSAGHANIKAFNLGRKQAKTRK